MDPSRRGTGFGVRDAMDALAFLTRGSSMFDCFRGPPTGRACFPCPSSPSGEALLSSFVAILFDGSRLPSSSPPLERFHWNGYDPYVFARGHRTTCLVRNRQLSLV